MPCTARHLILVLGLGVGFASPLAAQPALAHLSQVEGTVTRLHRFAPAVAGVGVVLVAGDQIVTAMGRAELTFVDGSVMHLDQHTQVSITAAARIRLIDGRISLRATTAYSAETATGIVHVLPEGVFELTANAANRDVLVHVVEGDARIESPSGVEAVRSTQTAFVSGPTGHSYVSPSIYLRHDSFVQWSNSRYLALVSASAGFATGQLRRDLAVATFGPPPPFLPYAYPTYRQFAYERSLRRPRFHHQRSDVTFWGEQVVRSERRRDGAVATSRRDGGPVRRAGGTSGREGGRPAAARPAPVRGAGKGAAIRQP